MPRSDFQQRVVNITSDYSKDGPVTGRGDKLDYTFMYVGCWFSIFGLQILLAVSGVGACRGNIGRCEPADGPLTGRAFRGESGRQARLYVGGGRRQAAPGLLGVVARESSFFCGNTSTF